MNSVSYNVSNFAVSDFNGIIDLADSELCSYLDNSGYSVKCILRKEPFSFFRDYLFRITDESTEPGTLVYEQQLTREQFITLAYPRTYNSQLQKNGIYRLSLIERDVVRQIILCYYDFEVQKRVDSWLSYENFNW